MIRRGSDMDNAELLPTNDVVEGEIIVGHANQLAVAGAAANRAASGTVFAAFQSRKAPHTRRRHQADLNLFREYLLEAGVVTGNLYEDAAAWHGVSWGLVAGFVAWQLQRGYAVGSVNVRLYTVKTYCQLALHAGVIDHAEYAQIKAVSGYSHREGLNIDKTRETTRAGRKKASAVSIKPEQARELKRQPTDTPQGRRDALLMCLLLDHGLRVSEIAGLQIEDFNLTEGIVTFYRPKVDLVQTHQLTADTLRAAMGYFLMGGTARSGPLLIGSRKDRKLSTEKMKGGKRKELPPDGDQAGTAQEPGMTIGAINKRVRFLGELIGLRGLSPHDCRHYWATSATRGGTDIKSLQDAGGWKSPSMPMRYVESQAVANKGVKLID